jgi:hypothetical protein
MAELDCRHDDTVDEAGSALDWAEVTDAFGEAAFCLSCPCGSWVVESIHGDVLARSGHAVVDVPALSHAA